MINSAEEFVHLRTSDVPEEYNRAAHEAASEQVWLEVLASYPNMAFWVIHNKTVPLSILELLANHSDSKIRRAVASKRKLSSTLFEQLAVDTDEYVRLAIVCNQKAPRYVLEQLAQDQRPTVREKALARLKLVVSKAKAT